MEGKTESTLEKTPEQVIIETLYQESIGASRYAGTVVNLMGILRQDLSNKYINELLQNADDANASEVNFYTTSNYLIIAYDGKPFSEKDVKAISDAASPERDKIDDTQAIGYKGIGFKSVFGISDYVLIRSREKNIKNIAYSFRFDRTAFINEGTQKKYPWEIIPIWTTDEDIQKDQELAHALSVIPSTSITIILKLGNPERPRLTKETIRKDLVKELENFCSNPKNILFLRHIQKVQHVEIFRGLLALGRGPLGLQYALSKIDTSTSNPAIISSEIRITKNNNVGRISEIVSRWYVKTFDIGVTDYDLKNIHKKFRDENSKVRIQLAIDDKSNLTSHGGSNVYCYFSTEITIPLSFVLNGDFILNTARSNFQNNQEALDWNRVIFSFAFESHIEFISELIELNSDDWMYYLTKIISSDDLKRDCGILADYSGRFINALQQRFKEQKALHVLVKTLDGSLNRITGIKIDSYDFIQQFGTVEQRSQFIASESAQSISNTLSKFDIQPHSMNGLANDIKAYTQRLKLKNREEVRAAYQVLLDYLAEQFSNYYFYQDFSPLINKRIYLNYAGSFVSNNEIFLASENILWQKLLLGKYLVSFAFYNSNPKNIFFLKNKLQVQELTIRICLEKLPPNKLGRNQRSILIEFTELLYQVFLEKLEEWETIKSDLRNLLKLKTNKGEFKNCREVYFPENSEFYNVMKEIYGEHNALHTNCIDLSAYGFEKTENYKDFFSDLGVNRLEKVTQQNFDTIFSPLTGDLNTGKNIKLAIFWFRNYCGIFNWNPILLAKKINKLFRYQKNHINFIKEIAVDVDKFTDLQIRVLKETNLLTAKNKEGKPNECYFSDGFHPIHVLGKYLGEIVLSGQYESKDPQQQNDIKKLFKKIGVKEKLSVKILQKILNDKENLIYKNREESINFIQYIFKEIYLLDPKKFTERYASYLRNIPIFDGNNKSYNTWDYYFFLPDIFNPEFLLQRFLPQCILFSKYYENIEKKYYPEYAKFLKISLNIQSILTLDNLPGLVEATNAFFNLETKTNFTIAVFKYLLKENLLPASKGYCNVLKKMELLASDGKFHLAKDCYLPDRYQPQIPLESQGTHLYFVSDEYCKFDDEDSVTNWKYFFTQIGVNSTISFTVIPWNQIRSYHLTKLERDFINQYRRHLSNKNLYRIAFIDQVLGTKIFWDIVVREWNQYKIDPQSNIKFYVESYCKVNFPGRLPKDFASPFIFKSLGKDNFLGYQTIQLPVELTEEQFKYFGFKTALTWEDCCVQLQSLAKKYEKTEDFPLETTDFVYQQILQLPTIGHIDQLKILTYGKREEKYQLIQKCFAINSDKPLDFSGQKCIFYLTPFLRKSENFSKLVNLLRITMIGSDSLEMKSENLLEEIIIRRKLQEKLNYYFLASCFEKGIRDFDNIQQQWKILEVQYNQRLEKLKIYCHQRLYFVSTSSPDIFQISAGVEFKEETSELFYVKSKIGLREYKNSLFRVLNLYFKLGISPEMFENIWTSDQVTLRENFDFCSEILYNRVFHPDLVSSKVVEVQDTSQELPWFDEGTSSSMQMSLASYSDENIFSPSRKESVISPDGGTSLALTVLSRFPPPSRSSKNQSTPSVSEIDTDLANVFQKMSFEETENYPRILSSSPSRDLYRERRNSIDPAIFQQIGDKGEKYVFHLIEQRYRKRFSQVDSQDRVIIAKDPKSEYPKNQKWNNTLFGKKVEWLIGNTHDMRITTFFSNGSQKIKDVEVKTTTQSTFHLSLSKNQVDYIARNNATPKGYYSLYLVAKLNLREDVQQQTPACIKLKDPKITFQQSNNAIQLTAKAKQVTAGSENQQEGDVVADLERAEFKL